MTGPSDNKLEQDDGSMRMLVELGRQWLSSQEVAGLAPGSVVEMQSDLDSQVDVYANRQWVGKGDLVVAEGRLGVRMLRLAGRSKSDWSKR